jgi:hypothetical protein
VVLLAFGELEEMLVLLQELIAWTVTPTEEFLDRNEVVWR